MEKNRGGVRYKVEKLAGRIWLGAGLDSEFGYTKGRI